MPTAAKAEYETFFYPVVFRPHHADLGDAVDRQLTSDSFEVDKGEAFRNRRGLKVMDCVKQDMARTGLQECRGVKR